jgi:tetratricopeptide (TPR) repeat protein
MIKNWKYLLALAASLTFSTVYSQTVKDARRAADLEKDHEAMKMLRQLNKTSPNEETALFLGDAYLRAGKTDSATIYYNQAAAANAKSPLAMIAAGKAALLQGNAAEAQSRFDEAIKRSKKKDPNIYMLIAQAYVDTKAKDNTKALEYINAANALTKNNNAEALIILGDVNLLNPNGGGPAMTAYDQAVQIDQKNAKAHLRRGQLFTRSRNYNEAQQAFQNALAADPNYAPAYRELGEMYYFVGKYDQSLENYKKYIAMSEDSPDTRAKYASFLFLTKDYPGTIKEAQAVLANDPNHPVMNRLLAFSLYETGQNDQALAALERYFQNAKPDQIIASDYAYYGRILSKAGKGDLAQQNLDKALQMDPNNAELQDDIATFYVKEKAYPKAIAIYRARLQAKPSLVDSYKLAEAYYAAKQYASADSLYALILTERPTYSPAILRRAQIGEEQDKPEVAKEHYQNYIKIVGEALAADPSKESGYRGGLLQSNFYLGLQAYNAKDYATARKYWTEAQRLDPANKDLANNLRNVDLRMKKK